MATVDPIRISGLRDLQAALRALDGESQKLLRVGLNEAAELVASDARRRMPSRSGKARASVKVASSQREARVKEGSAKAPYTPWLDYGGRVGRGRAVRRPFIPGGRYLYPSYSRNRDEILAQLEKSVVALVESLGLEVK